MISILAIASIASIAVLGNTQTAYAGVDCTVEPDMVDAGFLAVGDRFFVIKTIDCLADITDVVIDDTDCAAKGISVRLGDSGINLGVWNGGEVIEKISANNGKITCTVLFEVDFNESTEFFPQTIMVSPPIVPACGDMYVVTGGGFQTNTNVDGGALALVDFPGTGDLTQIGLSIADQVERRSLTGMAFDSSGRLFVVAQGSPLVGDGGSTPTLLEINPSTGAIIDDIGEVIDDGIGDPVRVRDLAMRNNVLWGVGEDNSNFESIFTIDTESGVTTQVGTSGIELNGLTITPDGTFFATERFANELYTVKPDTGATTVVVLLDTRMDGLGSDDEGKIYGTETGPDSVHLINIIDGTDETVGAVGDNPSDVDFFPCPIVPPVVGGELIPLESTSLILAGAQTFSWMIPVILSGIGIGLFVVSRKSENS